MYIVWSKSKIKINKLKNKNYILDGWTGQKGAQKKIRPGYQRIENISSQATPTLHLPGEDLPEQIRNHQIVRPGLGEPECGPGGREPVPTRLYHDWANQNRKSHTRSKQTKLLENKNNCWLKKNKRLSLWG